MITLDLVQGSTAWLQAKTGIPSASNAHKIITPKTGKMSASAEGYAHELIAEQLLGKPLDDATSEFMQRGTILEQSARKWYALQRDVDVQQVGFLLRDDRRVGCSPDGLIGADGGLEIKCPSAAVHIGYLLGDAGEKYKCQVQTALYITGRSWWDFVSYNPDLPSALVRFDRDEEFITKLDAAFDQFLSMLDEMKLKLVRDGHFSAEQMGTIAGLKVA